MKHLTPSPFRWVVLAYFREKKLSLGKAAELAGMGRLDFMDVLSGKGIVLFDYDESMLLSELDGIDQLNKIP